MYARGVRAVACYGGGRHPGLTGRLTKNAARPPHQERPRLPRARKGKGKPEARRVHRPGAVPIDTKRGSRVTLAHTIFWEPGLHGPPLLHE